MYGVTRTMRLRSVAFHFAREEKMPGSLIRYIGLGAFFILAQYSGYIVSRSVRPFPMITLLFHKASVLILIALLSYSIYTPLKNSPMVPILLLSILALSLILLMLVISGAVLSATKMPNIILIRMHGLIPYAAFACAILVLVLVRKII